MPFVYNFSQKFDSEKVPSPILLDTNVLADLYYDRNGIIQNNSMESLLPYHQVIRACLSNKHPLYISAHNILELFHIFLRHDHEIYNKISKQNCSIKVYRAISSEKQARASRYQLILDQIRSSGILITGLSLEEQIVNEFVQALDKNTMDANDFLLANLALEKDYAVLTDDGDYASEHPQCNIITINQQLLSAAQTLHYQIVA